MEKRSFKYDRVYTESEIRAVCPKASIEAGEYEDKTKYEFLVAAAEVEYWFIREGEDWKIDHTWMGITLVSKSATAD